MPNTHSTLAALFTDIADAIRNKTSTSAQIVADAFPTAIANIPTGGGITADDIAERKLSGVLSASVTSISDYAFCDCQSVRHASFPSCTVIGSYAFARCLNLNTASFPACTSIVSWAFASCTHLTTASFPACTSIGAYAFNGCTNLTTASFSACISIGNSTFNTCPSLTVASFPLCTNIGNYAFTGCIHLTNISFPACTSIGLAFTKCSSLESIYLLGSSVPTLSNTTAFNSTPISNSSYLGHYGSIIVQESMLSAFQTATNWSVYSSRFSVWNGVD